MKKKAEIIIILLFLFVNVAFSQAKTHYKYLFLGHTYMTATEIDQRLTYLNKSVYDNIWLGGDICAETLLYYSNLDYLNAKLKIKQPHNYWTLGNHDRRNGNIEWIEKYLGHKTYYVDYYNGFTAFIFDSNLDVSDCENLDKQYKLFCNVVDTITESSHLLLFFHWGLWSDVPGLPPDPMSYAHTGLKYWNANCDSVNTNFVNIIYPKLVKVAEKGVKVICIMGDIGKYYKKVDLLSSDGIHFLGCGVDNIMYRWNTERLNVLEKDLILVFDHDIQNKNITWQFMDLDSLLDLQHGYKYLTKLTFNNFELYPEENMEYIIYGNYMYKLHPGDSLTILDINPNFINAENRNIYFTGVFKTELDSAISNLKLKAHLISNDKIIEIDSLCFNEIHSKMKYFKDTISFEKSIQSCDRLIIYIKSETDKTILLNDIILKYKTNE
ncbi:MAG: hypothetical protein PHW83_05060 [Bacteroidales bacterium]|nr:hypothetical protein [Bacteroidales bacterium]